MFFITDFPGSCALSEIEVSIVSFFPQPLMYQMAWHDLTHLPGHHCFPQQSKPSGHGRRVHVNPERPAGHERVSDPSLKNGNGFPKSWFHVGHDDDVLEIKITFGHWGDNFISLLHQSDTTPKKKRCMKRIQRCRHKRYHGARSMRKLTAAIGPANVRFQVQKPPSNLPKLEHDTWNCGHKPKQGEVWSFRFATANVYLNLVVCCCPAHIDNV